MWTNFLIEEKFNKVKEQSKKLNELINKVNSESQIVPVIIGENDKTIKIAECLQSKGFYILPVRPPTVPVGTSRLRLSLTADITYEEYKSVISIAEEMKNEI